jgi:hypothetical protein
MPLGSWCPPPTSPTPQQSTGGKGNCAGKTAAASLWKFGKASSGSSTRSLQREGREGGSWLDIKFNPFNENLKNFAYNAATATAIANLY